MMTKITNFEDLTPDRKAEAESWPVELQEKLLHRLNERVTPDQKFDRYRDFLAISGELPFAHLFREDRDRLANGEGQALARSGAEEAERDLEPTDPSYLKHLEGQEVALDESFRQHFGTEQEQRAREQAWLDRNAPDETGGIGSPEPR